MDNGIDIVDGNNDDWREKATVDEMLPKNVKKTKIMKRLMVSKVLIQVYKVVDRIGQCQFMRSRSFVGTNK